PALGWGSARTRFACAKAVPGKSRSSKAEAAAPRRHSFGRLPPAMRVTCPAAAAPRDRRASSSFVARPVARSRLRSSRGRSGRSGRLRSRLAAPAGDTDGDADESDGNAGDPQRAGRAGGRLGSGQLRLKAPGVAKLIGELKRCDRVDVVEGIRPGLEFLIDWVAIDRAAQMELIGARGGGDEVGGVLAGQAEARAQG